MRMFYYCGSILYLWILRPKIGVKELVAICLKQQPLLFGQAIDLRQEEMGVEGAFIVPTRFS